MLARARSGSARLHLEPGKWNRQDIADTIALMARRNDRNPGSRTLIGIDCNFGYAREIAIRQFGQNYIYKDLWERVEEICQDQSDFYASEFWHHPDFAPYFWTRGQKPQDLALTRRITEQSCKEQGVGVPESPFKLIGPKQVGKGGLSGMRMAHYLKNRYPEQIAIWPFEFEQAARAPIVITEIYPRLFIRKAGLGNAKVSQRAYLKEALEFYNTDMPCLTETFTDHKSDALIAAAGLRSICGHGPDIPASLSSPSGLDPVYARTEGWIFGVT